MGLLSSKKDVVSERPCDKLARRGTSSGGYSIIKTLGKGGQGTTEICRRHKDDKTLVRKTQKEFSMFGDEPREMYLFEKVLIPHPHILKFDCANWVNKCGSLVLYFEHCEGGDLTKQVPKDTYLSEDYIWHVFIQLADALAYLHYGTCMSHSTTRPHRGWKRTIHRDMKPANIFLRRPVTSKRPIPDVVIGDFGLATFKDETPRCGTDEWVAPDKPHVTKQGDVWGLGAIIHFLAHGQGPVDSPPEDVKGKRAVSEWYWSPKARNPRNMPSFYSAELNRNMMDCLLMNAESRVTSKELLSTLKREMPKHLREHYGV